MKRSFLFGWPVKALDVSVVDVAQKQVGNGPAENRVTELEPFCSYFSLSLRHRDTLTGQGRDVLAGNCG